MIKLHKETSQNVVSYSRELLKDPESDRQLLLSLSHLLSHLHLHVTMATQKQLLSCTHGNVIITPVTYQWKSM